MHILALLFVGKPNKSVVCDCNIHLRKITDTYSSQSITAKLIQRHQRERERNKIIIELVHESFRFTASLFTSELADSYRERDAAFIKTQNYQVFNTFCLQNILVRLIFDGIN